MERAIKVGASEFSYRLFDSMKSPGNALFFASKSALVLYCYELRIGAIYLQIMQMVQNKKQPDYVDNKQCNFLKWRGI
jgi:hypothetical protein